MSLAQQMALARTQDRITPGRSFRDSDEVEEYLDRLIGGDWWAEMNLPILDVHVEIRPNFRKWLGVALYPNGIVLAREGLTESTVLHELAHLLTPEHRDHGNEFIRVLLKLVREQMGFFAWVDLAQEIEDSGVFETPTPRNN